MRRARRSEGACDPFPAARSCGHRGILGAAPGKRLPRQRFQTRRPGLGRRDTSAPAGQRSDGAAGLAVTPEAGQRRVPSIAGQPEEPVVPVRTTAPVTGHVAVSASRAERASNENVTSATTEAPRSQETIRERVGFMAAFTSHGLRAAGPSGCIPVQYRR